VKLTKSFICEHHEDILVQRDTGVGTPSSRRYAGKRSVALEEAPSFPVAFRDQMTNYTCFPASRG